MNLTKLIPAGLALCFSPTAALATLNVVATIPDFGAIAKEIGGDRVSVKTIARGTEDPHFVDAKPSHMRTLNKADLLIEGGVDLEIGWLPPLVRNARNSKILRGQPGNLAMAEGIRLLEVPTAPVDRSMGDVHPHGNPHFWLDPANGAIMAKRIARRLAELDTENAGVYEVNLKRFKERLELKLKDWSKRMAPHRGVPVVTYHKSFEYLLDRFGLELVDTIEPRPGIEPSASHINALVPKMKKQGVKLILVEPFRPRRTPTIIAEASGAKLVLLPEMVGGDKQAQDYIGLFDVIVEKLTSSLAANE